MDPQCNTSRLNGGDEDGEDPYPSLLVTDTRWHRLVPNVERLVRRVLADEHVHVVLADDLTLRRLNARHQAHGPVGSNRPTNVLTFTDTAEIILASGVVAREARSAGLRPAQRLAHLLVHGALHLAGHEHDRPGEALRMEMAESRRLAKLGVPNPWKFS